MDVDNTAGGVDTNVSAGSGGGESLNSAPAEPQVIDIPDDNALVRVKGSDKPVKFSDFKGFQSQWTKEAQRRAQLERELQAERERIRHYERERQDAARRMGQNERPDPFAKLKELPYLSGNDALEVVQTISQEIGHRDRLIMGMLQEMQRQQQVIQQLYGNHSQTSFESKIDKFLADGGYGPEWKNIAKRTYLAYEGDDLDDQFPQILEETIKEAEAAIEARKRAAIERNRKPAFVPGRGGDTGPTRPLQIKPDASAKEVSDLLWDQIHADSRT